MAASNQAFEYDAPMFYDFEASESPLGQQDRADDWFDTSATKGLQSPSGSGKSAEKEKEREVTSAARGRARSVLGEITNAATVNGRHVVSDEAIAAKPVSTGLRVVHKPVTRSQSAVSAPKPCGVTNARATQRPSNCQSKPPHRGRQLTVPKSPMLLSRLRSDGRVRVKSTEELEVEQIERERQALSKAKRKHTAAEGANRDSSRLKKRVKTACVNVMAGGFTMGAEAVDIGGKRQTRSSTRAKAGERAWKPKLTVPRSPAFATNSRIRPPRYKSTEEIQLEEIAKVRLAKAAGKVGGIARLDTTELAPNTRPISRPSKLKIPEPTKFESSSRGAKSTTAARSVARAQPAASARTVRSVRSATAQPTQASVFGGGPITRSRAHVVETKKRDKGKALLSPRDGLAKEGTTEADATTDPSLGPAASAEKNTEYTTNTSTDKVMKMNTRSRLAIRGVSMLRGGALRVARTEAEEQEQAVQDTQDDPGVVVGKQQHSGSSMVRDPPMTRGRSILDRISGVKKENQQTGKREDDKGLKSSPRTAFEQLSRKEKHHNPLFEFKHF